MARRTDDGDEAASLNQVRLRGRLGGVLERSLPSGDVLATFRLVVDRPAGHPSGARVDTLDCSVTKAALRRRVLGWQPGDVIEVDGSLRRRFFRAGGGSASRYEVEVDSVRRVARAAAVTRATMAG